MAYNTKKIKKDVDGNPVPQVYNPAADEYEALKGDSGAARHVLYGPDGSPVDTTGSKLGVRDDEVAQALVDILAQLDTTGLKKIIDALPAGNNKIGKVDVEASALPAGAATEAKQDSTISELQNLQGKDFATQTTLAAILSKIISAPATEAKQDTIIGYVDGVEAVLANILAKIIASPATEAKQDALITKDFATQTTLAAVLEKLSADPATQATLAAVLTKLNAGISTTLTGSNLAEQKTQTNAVSGIVTFTENLSTVEIYNTDVLNDGVFTVNGIAINVPKGIAYKSTIGGIPGKTVTVTGATTYIVSRYV